MKSIYLKKNKKTSGESLNKVDDLMGTHLNSLTINLEDYFCITSIQQ